MKTSEDRIMELINLVYPKITDIDLGVFEFTVDNHLDGNGARTRAQTTDIKFRLKDGRFVEVHIE